LDDRVTDTAAAATERPGSPAHFRQERQIFFLCPISDLQEHFQPLFGKTMVTMKKIEKSRRIAKRVYVLPRNVLNVDGAK